MTRAEKYLAMKTRNVVKPERKEPKHFVSHVQLWLGGKSADIMKENPRKKRNQDKCGSVNYKDDEGAEVKKKNRTV